MKKSNESLLSTSAEETLALGAEFGKRILLNSVVALFGDLGSGKTTFVKGVISGLSTLSPHEILSPTFTYLNIYSGTCPLFHFDLYRLKKTDDFQALGFDDYFQQGGICFIEWPEIIEELLPPQTIRIELTYGEENRRLISIPNVI